jgi:phosphoribosylamine---glycine ligase
MERPKIAVIGNGSREDGICETLHKSPQNPEIYCLPGNAGTERWATNVPIGRPPTDEDPIINRFSYLRDIVSFVEQEGIDLTVIGPERPLADGIVDYLDHWGHLAFGPSSVATILESKKTWASDLMKRHNIPGAKSVTIQRSKDITLEDQIKRAMEEFGTPVVVKPDGLTEGKGVTICRTEDEVKEVVDLMVVKGIYKTAGHRVQIQELLEGPELSVMAFADGETVIPMVPASDYKLLKPKGYDRLKNPNTGGMGAYTRPSFATADLMAQIQAEILEPTLHALAAEGRPYRGVLYAGLMITKAGPKVLEFNSRFGDPEAQVVLPLLDSDFVKIAFDVARGTLDPESVLWKSLFSCAVVLAAEGYPQAPVIGIPINGFDNLGEDDHVSVGGAIRDEEGNIVSSSGRIMTVWALGESRKAARANAYKTANLIKFPGKQYRRDIGLEA